MNFHYNMKEIPKHCIDTFKERYGAYPSVVELTPTMSKEDTDKFLSKSHLLWFENFVNNDYEVVPMDRLYEYDASGILILRKSHTKIFILTKVDKQNVVDFILLQLKRLTKKD